METAGEEIRSRALGLRVLGIRRPWFQMEPADETFFDTAPVRLVSAFDISRSAAEVWDELSGPDALQWCRLLGEVRWTSLPPFGVGTTRIASALAGLSVLKERFFRWEEGRRQSFVVVEASTPMFRRFAEDYLLEPTSDTSCRLTWTIAFEPRPVARVANPLNKLLLGTLFHDTSRHYGSQACTPRTVTVQPSRADP